MLPFMNLNEFGDNFRKTKCKSGRATLVSISQTAKILFKAGVTDRIEITIYGSQGRLIYILKCINERP
jgi:hypothetical protein